MTARRTGKRAGRRAAACPEQGAPGGTAFVLSCVDLPRPGERLWPGAMLTGKGWAVSDMPITSIAVHLGELFLCYAAYGQPRPEIGRDYPHYRQAAHSGFAFSVRLGPEIAQARGSDLEFRFRTDAGESRRHVRLSWADAAAGGEDAIARPWPIRLALEECRIDTAGRLRLRGWAIAHSELTGLDLYLNETRLHAPERGLARPDIAERHPAYPGAGQAGFRLVQTLDAPPGERDAIRVVAQAGTVQRQIVVPLAGGEARPRLLHDAAVTLCCETMRLSPAGALLIEGWATGAAETREIELFAGPVSLGLAETGIARPDIGNRFPRLPGARFAGFRYAGAAPAELLAGGALTLAVRDSAGGERKLPLVLPPPGEADAETIHAGIDSPALREGRAVSPIHGLVSIAGWAVSASGIAAVEVFADDEKLGDAFLGVRREEIGSAFPDLPQALTAGFALTVPHRRLGDGEHAIRVVIRARSGLTAEERFRVVLETDDDRAVGVLRRSVAAGETALRMELLAAYGALPEMCVVIRSARAGEPRGGLAASLESLRRQSLSRWRAVVVVDDAAARREALALAAGDPALDGRVRVVLAGRTGALWPHPPGARFELLCVMRPGDRFGADALMAFAVELRVSGAAFVYADERCFDPARNSVRPFLKPGWSPELLLSMNYFGRAWCATRALAVRAGVDLAGLEARGDYDAVLRLTEAAELVAHLPQCLAERAGRRIETRAREQAALLAAAARRGLVADVSPGLHALSWRVKRAVAPGALVSVIVPTCGERGLIRRAIETLRGCTGYAPIEIVVLDNVPEAEAGLRAWLAAQADVVVPMPGPFNWSRANNAGARAARGAYLLFLNDDTECTDPGWLAALLEYAQLPEVGAVGPQLLYPDGKVQHAGMFLRGAEGLHAFRFADADAPGAFGLALTPREVTAVTGACLLTRRAVFDRLGGFDENHSVIKNDLDYCLRLGASGLRVIYTPHARLTHHEMASRAALADDFDAARFDGAWAIRQLQGDPLVNPNLSAESGDFLAEIEPVEWLQPGPPRIDRAQIREILVVKLDHVGDLVTALPAIARLRAAFAQARITLLAGSGPAALAQALGVADRVVVFDVFAAKSAAGTRAVSEAELAALAAQLRQMHFDIAVDLRVHGDTRHMLRYAGAGLCAGFDQGGRFPWLDIAVEWDGDLKLADKRAQIGEVLLRLAAAVDAAAGDAPALRPPADAPITLARLLDEAGAASGFALRPLVCVHPGAGTSLKQWPAANFSGLIRLLLDAHEVGIVLIGSGDEAGLAREVLAPLGPRADVVSLAGVAAIADLPSVLAGCALFVGNDSGPKHLAAALGVPTVGVHAAQVDAAEWGGAGRRAISLRRAMQCGPCYLSVETDCPRGVACLRGISPAQVYRACRLLLGLTAARARASAAADCAGAAD